MQEALTLEMLHRMVKHRYDTDEQRVVGLMLARYDIPLTRDMIDQCYLYWHKNTGKNFDVYWAGYGEYLSPQDESPFKTVMDFRGNEDRAYFDMDAFIDFKNECNRIFETRYNDHPWLVLMNYRDGRLHFDESIRVDLEDNYEGNMAKLRSVMEEITWLCRSESSVTPIARYMKFTELKDIIKGISVSDVIGKAISLAGML